MTTPGSARTRRRTAAPALLLALAAAATLVAIPAPARGQVPSDATLKDFHRIGDYVLVVDGKEVPAAEIYQTDRLPTLLIVTSALPSPVLLSQRTGAVETVSVMKVSKQPDGTVDLLADAVPTPQGQFTIQGEEISFKIAGKQGTLKQKPPLLGLKRSDDLRAYSPSYGDGARNYRPDGQAIAALRKSGQPITVRVFFGSWCSFCKRYLPNMLRVEDELKGSKVKIEYYGLPHDIKSDTEAKRLDVNGVPTAVVYVGGKEAGRITGNSWSSPETSLTTILQGAAALRGR